MLLLVLLQVLLATLVVGQSERMYPILLRMNVVTADVVAVNDSLNKLQSGSIFTLPQALKMASQQRKITRDTELVAAALDALEEPLDADDSARLRYESAFHDWFLRSMLQNFVRQREAFQSAVFYVGDISLSLHAGLKDGKGRIHRFDEAAQRVVAPGTVLPEMESLAAWDEAIDAFEQCGGRICLPSVHEYRKHLGL